MHFVPKSETGLATILESDEYDMRVAIPNSLSGQCKMPVLIEFECKSIWIDQKSINDLIDGLQKLKEVLCT